MLLRPGKPYFRLFYPFQATCNMHLHASLRQARLPIHNGKHITCTCAPRTLPRRHERPDLALSKSSSRTKKSAMSSDKVLAGPSAACCLRGTIHTGSPSGTISEIAGVQTYVATPSADKAKGNIVLYFPDVFGLFTNGQLIMDGFAEAGYLVFGPDYFRGVRQLFESPLRVIATTSHRMNAYF